MGNQATKAVVHSKKVDLGSIRKWRNIAYDGKRGGYVIIEYTEREIAFTLEPDEAIRLNNE